MNRLHLAKLMVLVVSLLLLANPALLQAQPQAKPAAPPIGQPLVDEGTFAARLASALGVAETEDEVEAESLLGEAGIAPRNGWIAGYPVTPDIIVELQKAVADAADSEKISLERDEALKKLDEVIAGFGLSVKPYSAGQRYEPSPASCENYPNPAAISNSYSAEGPPVVTYYCPPPDYYNMYAWVPSPFWWSGFWFSGFFILHDFHRVVVVNKRVVVIRNHFNDVRTQRAFRVDPVARFSGRTFAGIGVSRPGNFLPTGVPRSERTIFNGSRARGGRTFAPERGGERLRPPAGGGRMEGISPGGSRGGRGGRR